MPPEDARTAAEILIHADLMGIDSHGIAHLMGHRDYVPGLRNGAVSPLVRLRIEHETPATARVDAQRGFGLLVAHRAMNLAIEKARSSGIGMISVANSSHIGAIGHYALMAIPQDMIGIAMTNAPPQVVPTFAIKPMLGTNPIAVAIPAKSEPPFLLDMATSVVAAGKLEIAQREERPIPEGWAVDAEGKPSTDPFIYRKGGGLLPLGSWPMTSSYKGYGLGMLVDILCGVLSTTGFGAMFSREQWRYSHLFAALRIDAFQPAEEFKGMMDQMLNTFRTLDTAPGAQRVLYPGLREWEMEQRRRKEGIPLNGKVISTLEELGRELGVPFPKGLARS